MTSILSIHATHVGLFEFGLHFLPPPPCMLSFPSRPSFLSSRRVIHIRVSAGYLVSLSMFAQSFEMCSCVRVAPPPPPANRPPSSVYLALHCAFLFRSPTATTIRASSRGWTTTRASCCAAPTPSARGAGSTSRPTPGRATSSSRRSSPGGGSAPTTRGTTPRPSSRVSGIRIRWHREREAGRRKWRKGVKCRHCKQMRSCVSSPVEC